MRRRRPPPGFLRLAAAVLVLALIALSDGWLYLARGVDATYSLRTYRLCSAYPIVAAATGSLATWWALRSKAADDWKMLILAVGSVAGHTLWPVLLHSY